MGNLDWPISVGFVVGVSVWLSWCNRGLCRLFSPALLLLLKTKTAKELWLSRLLGFLLWLHIVIIFRSKPNKRILSRYIVISAVLRVLRLVVLGTGLLPPASVLSPVSLAILVIKKTRTRTFPASDPFILFSAFLLLAIKTYQ
jgi:hypothetical protein